MALRARKVSGAFEKRAPGEITLLLGLSPQFLCPPKCGNVAMRAKKYSLTKEALAVCKLVHLLNKEFSVLLLRSLRQQLHTTPEKLQSTEFLLRSGLPSTLIRHENGAYPKRPLNRRNLKTLAFRFREDGNILKTGLSRHDDHVNFLTVFCSITFDVVNSHLQ